MSDLEKGLTCLFDQKASYAAVVDQEGVVKMAAPVSKDNAFLNKAFGVAAETYSAASDSLLSRSPISVNPSDKSCIFNEDKGLLDEGKKIPMKQGPFTMKVK
ncbi:MAG: hypothetical protein WC043_02290 [Pseudobdellovibrionaceae bacterium]